MNRNMRRRSLLLLLILTLVVSVSVVRTEPETVYAATFVVNNTNDAVDINPGDGECRTNPSGTAQCTLRAAIQEANAFPGADVIQLPSGTYTLTITGNEDNATAGDLDIPVGSVTIVGAGAGTTTIDGNGIDRVFHVIGGTLELRDLTVTGGNITGDGGAIYNDVGNVVLRGTNIVGNTATRGGGIFNRFGSITVLDASNIGASGNPNTASGDGGGIFSQYNAAATGNTVTIERSTVAFNTSGGDGGGIYVTDDGDLIITNSTIANNSATGDGGGIFVADTTTDSTTVFTLTDSTVDNNSADGTGGIHIEGVSAPTITNATISNNTSTNGAGGLSYNAPLANFGTITLTITNTVFDDNDSTNATGGIVNAAGNNASNTTVIVMNNSTIQNSDGAAVGAIFNEQRGTLNITRSTITANNATGTGSNGVGGALNNRGQVTILESTLSNNSATVYGGAIVNRPNATLTINRSTLSGNTNSGGSALGGGAIMNNGGTLNIDTSTISGNSTSSVGGGIANLVLSAVNGLVTIRSSTIANNGAVNGGGVYNETSTTSLQNTILADNTASGSGAECLASSGSINSQGWVLVQTSAGCNITQIVTLGNRFDVSAGLLPLANNGGPTFTHRLNAGTSQAIDAGANCQLDPPAPSSVDQRGTGFVRLVDIPTVINQPSSDGCDIGAFEVQSTTNAILGNFVFDDLNANGLQDIGEPGIANFPVNLLDSSGTTVLQSTTTDTNGFYRFDIPIPQPPGTAQYIVEFDLAAAITGGIVSPDAGFTLQNVGANDEIDSDADPTTGPNGGRANTPPLQGGDTNLSIDAGIVTPGSIGDFVWEDIDGDGIQDPSEPGLGGVVVTLYTSSGVQVAQQVTLDNTSGTPGFYTFTGVTAGSYYIEFSIPSPALDGYVFTLANQGSDDTVDSDADPLTGRTNVFVFNSGQDIQDFDAGVYQLGALNGFVWEDINGDGLYQIGVENPVQNVLVELVNTTTGLVDYSALTDVNGLYVFDETVMSGTGILPGTYDVVFTPPSPYDSFTIQDANSNGNDDIDSDVNPTTGSFDNLLIQSGTTVNDLSAGIYESGVIEGFIFNDADVNGVYQNPPDSIYTGGSAVTLRLRDGDGNLLTPTTTPDSVNGTYSFTGLVPGDYIVEIVLPTGTVLSQKDAGPDNIDSDFYQSNGFTDVITVNSGQTVSDIDAGLQPAVALSGTVWNDSNVNGLQDGVGSGGESGQAGVTVQIYAADGFTLITSTTTDSNGNYSFPSLPAGLLVVAVQPPAGRGFTTQQANPTLNSDVNQYTGRATVTLQQGVPNDVDAGLVDAFQIGNFIFEDTNANGLQDSGVDVGLQGVTIRLLSAGEVQLAQTQSSPTGNYAFYLTPGLSYIIELDLLPGYTFTLPNVGADDTRDSDAVPYTATTARINFTATAADNTLDGGLYRLNNISGIVFTDVDENGLRDPGEPGVNGVTVTLLDGNGQPLSPPLSVTTSGSGATAGSFSFSNLEAGNYILAVTPPSNTTFTFQDVNGNANDDRDSDVNANTGRVSFTLTSNQNLTFGAGLIDGVSISGTVWADLDADGRQDDVPLDGVPGVTVNLYRTTGGIALLGSTITDANGNYIFTVNTNETYIIEVVLPASYRRVPQDVDQSNPLVDIPTDSDTSETDGRVTVEVLTSPVDIDAGLEPLSLIGDFVFEDLNGNGTQDTGEPGAPNITVNLLDSTGTTVLDTQTTDPNGLYAFVDLAAGQYIVEFIPPPQRFLTVQITGGSPGVPNDSDPDPLTGRTPVIDLSAGERDDTIDAGLQPPAQIGGFVWDDVNSNGIQDSGENGRSGITVNLLDSAGDPLVPPVSTTTDGSGNYLFDNLQAGSYIVEVVAPSGEAFTLQDQGGDDNLDSDVNAIGRTAVLTLTTGSLQFLNIDAGLVQGGSISGVVWNDLNQDGIRDSGEPFVENVTVNLLDGTGTPFPSPVTITTNSSGAYSFPALFPQDYIVEFVLPATANTFSPQDVGSDDTVDSDAGVSTGRTSVITVTQGSSTTNVDAGIIFPIRLEVFVWEDLDSDGIQDASETGLAGATVELYRVGTPDLLINTQTSTTGPAPNVVFDSNSISSLTSGVYYIVVTPPSGYALSPVDQGSDDTLDSDPNPTTRRSPNFTLNSGTTISNIDAGAFTATVIGGQAFIDTNGDGIQDVGEIGYNGLTVNIYRVTGTETLFLSTVTVGSGLYTFGVPDGTYVIEFVDPGASISFSPANQGSDDSIDSDASIINGRTAQFNVPGGGSTVTDLNNIDVGLIQTGLEPLAVTKRYETAATPPLQAGDELYWVICARNVNLTAVNGVVVTDDIDTDTQIIQSATYGVASACPSGIPVDPDFDISGPTAVPSSNISASGQVTVPTINGLNPNEVVLLVIRVTIAEPGSVYMPTTETGALAMSSILLLLGGLFQPLRKRRRLTVWLCVVLALMMVLAPFSQTFAENLVNKTQQQTQEAQYGRWVRIDSDDPILQQVGSWQTITDTNAEGSSYLYSEDVSAALTLPTSGTQVRLQYVAMANSAAVTIFANSQQIGLVEDYSTTGTNVFRTSNAFNIPNSENTILRVQNAGYSSNPDVTSFAIAIDAIDIWIPETPNPENLSNLTGIVWQDTNGNGQLDSSDRLLEGIVVDLYLDYGTNDTLVASSTTDENGRYSFSGLRPDTYFVVVDRDSVPAELDPTSVNWSPLTIQAPYEGGDIIIPSGSVAPVYYQLGGTTYLDNDRSRDVSSDDTPLGGVEINLYLDDGDRVFDPSTNGDFIVSTTTSDENGIYLFDQILNGVYWLEVNMNSLPAEADPNQVWRLLWVNVPNVTEANLLLLPAPESYTVSGGAYLDNNFNRAVDENDTPLGGLTLNLYYENGDGVFTEGADPLVGTVTTAEDGSYSFSDLMGGVHWLIPDMDNLPQSASPDQIWPPLWIRVPNINETNVLLLPAPPAVSERGNGTLTGVVFNDDNGNRRYDIRRESGISEVVVRLFLDDGDGNYNAADQEIAITETDGNGVYTFEGLIDGVYWVLVEENTLPENYMDTVSYGGHGEQNPAQFTLIGANESLGLAADGPRFAYALDTDLDGSPDGREGAGDRDNDNIPNYLDAYDPTGVIYGADVLGNTVPLVGVEVSLIYRDGDEIILADTIQPNPQRTGSNGEYRFDLVDSETGLPPDGSERVFELIVEGINEQQFLFPSEINPPAGTLRLSRGNGQVAPFNTPDPSEEYYLAFAAQLGDDDIVNNNPVGQALEMLNADIENTACANFTGGSQSCATSNVNFELTVEFSLDPLSDSATGLANQQVTFTHTLTNDGQQPDSYRITLASTESWTQTLRILDGSTTLGTISVGGSFDTPELNPNESLTLELVVTVPVGGVTAGDFNNSTITATSIDSITLGSPVSEQAVDTVTVGGGSITGVVYNDANNNAIFDTGEGLSNVRIIIRDSSGAVLPGDIRTASPYSVGGLAAGSYTVSIDETTLPAGQVTFLSPTTNSQTVNVVEGQTATADFRLRIEANPEVIKSASTTSALPGEVVTFSVLVRNPGATTIDGTSRTIAMVDPVNTVAFTNVTAQITGQSGDVLAGPVTVTAPSQIVNVPITRLGPNAQFTVTITATVLETVTRGQSYSNTARIDINSVQVAQSTVSVLIPTDSAIDTDGDGVPDSEDPDPNDPNVTGTEDDFGTGGTTEGDTTATGTGEAVAEPDADTLPQTGYMPIEYFNTAEDDGYQTTRLSTLGRIIIGAVGLLALAMAFIMYRFYNDSEMLYEWIQKRKGMGAAILAIIILAFLIGSFSLLYTANDIVGVVDVDNILGINDSSPAPEANNSDAINVDGGNTAPSDAESLEARNSATSTDLNGITWVDNNVATQLPTLPLLSNTSQFVIPTLNLYTKLVNAPRVGTTWDVSHFFDEVAFLEGTAPPGVEGNTVIAGHVTHTRGLGPFRTLDKIQVGDVVIVRDYDIEYSYFVTDIMEVAASDIWVTKNVVDDAILTLVTCSGWNPNTRTYATRLIVKARLNKWRIVNDDENAFEQPSGERRRYEVGQSEGLELEGNWKELNSFNTSNGSYFYSEDKEASATFTFRGDKFRLSYMMFNNFGEFEVYLDGELIMTVDAYSEYAGYSTTGVIQVEPGFHKLEIRNTGRANDASKGNIIGLDAIDIWG